MTAGGAMAEHSGRVGGGEDRLCARSIGDLRRLDEDDEGLFEDLVQLYIREATERAAALSAAIARADIEATIRHAHRLKGSSGHIGARRLMVMCGAAERLARTRDPSILARLVAISADVADELGAVIAALERELHLTG